MVDDHIIGRDRGQVGIAAVCSGDDIAYRAGCGEVELKGAGLQGGAAGHTEHVISGDGTNVGRAGEGQRALASFDNIGAGVGVVECGVGGEGAGKSGIGIIRSNGDRAGVIVAAGDGAGSGEAADDRIGRIDIQRRAGGHDQSGQIPCHRVGLRIIVS